MTATDPTTKAPTAVGDTGPDPSERRLTAKGTERKRQLVEVAIRLFADQGYSATPVGQIVDEAGVGKGVFYWYFDSKEALFAAILADSQLALRRAQSRAMADVADPIDRIEAGARATMRWAAEHREIFELIRVAERTEEFRDSLARGQKIAVSDIAQLLHAELSGVTGGSAGPELLAESIYGMTNHLASRVVGRDGRDPDEVADHLTGFIRRGISGLA